MCSENPSYQTVFEETIKSEQRLKDKNWNKGDLMKLKSELKQVTDILEVAQDLGITVQKNGRNFVGICPFHGENTPLSHKKSKFINALGVVKGEM